MARYRIGESPETGGLPVTDDIYIAAVVFGLILGIGFTIVGFRVKQYWLGIWGAGLALVSLAYIGYEYIL